MERGIVRLIRLYHEDPTNPVKRIRENLGLKCLFEERPSIVETYLNPNKDRPEWPSLGGGCVEAGMRITLPGGKTKPIVEVGVGELVVTWDCERGATSVGRVVSTRSQVVLETFRINGRLLLSAAHPVLTPTRWVRVSKVAIGDRLQLGSGGLEEVMSLERIAGRHLVIDLTVSPSPTFIVEGIVVHNK
jgi:hypothetical protein